MMKVGLIMDTMALAALIQDRINELKSEQIGLRSFIASDQCLWEGLEKAINELSWVLKKLKSKEE